ncbi:MAG: hypothetical protein Q4E06_00720 [Lautropia sp.]|nr:hypothetical protein [Lautropia sp.]
MIFGWIGFPVAALPGVVTCKAIDPVVLSVTSTDRFGWSSQGGNVSFKPEGLLQLNPSVAFAVNDRVTLSGGLQWLRRSAALPVVEYHAAGGIAGLYGGGYGYLAAGGRSPVGFHLCGSWRLCEWDFPRFVDFSVLPWLWEGLLQV